MSYMICQPARHLLHHSLCQCQDPLRCHMVNSSPLPTGISLIHWSLPVPLLQCVLLIPLFLSLSVNLPSHSCHVIPATILAQAFITFWRLLFLSNAPALPSLSMRVTGHSKITPSHLLCIVSLSVSASMPSGDPFNWFSLNSVSWRPGCNAGCFLTQAALCSTS